MLDTLTRAPGGARLLYSAAISADVPSGISSTTSSNTFTSTGDFHPPPFGSGSRLPVRRYLCTQMLNVVFEIWNRPATCLSVPPPLKYVSTARSLRSFEYGFGIPIPKSRFQPTVK